MLDSRLCTHDELPAWCKDNAFILTGYRRPGGDYHEIPQQEEEEEEDDAIIEVPLMRERTGETDREHGSQLKRRGPDPSKGKTMGRKEDKVQSGMTAVTFRHDTVAKCWGSVWGYFHNETINIHTHLWGALLSITILFLHALHHFSLLPSFFHPLAYHPIFFPPHIPLSLSRSAVATSPNHWQDTVGFSIFLVSSLTCLGFSSSFHALSCHSARLAHKFNKLDYVGIVVMIVGSFLPALHHGFRCHPAWQTVYSVAIASLGAVAMYVVVAPHYSTPAYRPVRTAIFLALGLSSMVPVAHGVAMYGVKILDLAMGLKFLALEGTLYVVGALLYACRVPERWSKGRFDLVGASHQIFHVCILFAALSHYIALRRAYTFWHVSHGEAYVPVEGVHQHSFSSPFSSFPFSFLLPGESGLLGGASSAKGDRGREAVCLALDRWRSAAVGR